MPSELTRKIDHCPALLDATDIRRVPVCSPGHSLKVVERSPAQQQTLYAFRDGTDTTPLPIPATPLKRGITGMEPLPNTSSAAKFGLAAKPDKGWYDDLPTDPNQRIIVPPQAAAGVIGYVGTSPPLDDPCLTALPATIYARAYSTGQSRRLCLRHGAFSGNRCSSMSANSASIGCLL